jgi:hypothetical protein
MLLSPFSRKQQRQRREHPRVSRHPRVSEATIAAAPARCTLGTSNDQDCPSSKPISRTPARRPFSIVAARTSLRGAEGGDHLVRRLRAKCAAFRTEHGQLVGEYAEIGDLAL